MKFKDIGSALNYISSQIDASLLDNVQKAVKKTEVKFLNSVVYASYAPVMYGRRGSAGGLADENNMIGALSGKNTLSVKNQTPSSPSVITGGVSTDLAQWVISGSVKDIWHYGKRYSYPWTGTRDFITPAIAELRGGIAEQRLRTGLKSRGLKIK